MFVRSAYRPDVARNKLPTLATLKLLTELLSRFGYNELHLPAALFPADEIRTLSLYGEMNGVELVDVSEETIPADLRTRGLFHLTGRDFYVEGDTCAGRSLSGRVEEMRTNLETAEKTGRAGGIRGFRVVDHDDFAHWQPLAVSLPGLILGGALARDGATAAKMNLEEALDAAMGVPLGGTLLRLGTLYLRGGARRTGETELFRILANDRGFSRHPGLTDCVLAEISAVAEGCRHAASVFTSPTLYRDGAVWAEEIVHIANLVDAACNRRDERRLRFLREDHARIWRLRNRETGLEASLAKLPRF